MQAHDLSAGYGAGDRGWAGRSDHVRPRLIMMIRERWPHQVIHLSVQANVVNWAAVKFWQWQGIQRIILSRELSLEEVAEIRTECSDIEIETFVHGALCIAYSGRCLLSGYVNRRDPNQGTCTNACRWQYKTLDATQDATGDLIPVAADTERAALIEDVSRPGKRMPLYEDEHGTYLFNSKDLRAVQHVARLARLGVASLKIEGRTKSHYYVARTAQVYRQAIDDAVAGRPFDMGLMDQLENLANRGYTEGFYRRHVHDEFQNYERGHSVGVHQQFVGDIIGVDATGSLLDVEVKNRFEVGDAMELMLPSGNRRFVLKQMENGRGEYQTAAPGSGHRVRIALPGAPIAPEQWEFALLMRDLPTAPSHTPAQASHLGVAVS